MSAYALRPILPIPMSPRVIADGCRDAALAFCRGVRGGWSKRELAAWLRGPYATVSSLVDEAIAPPVDAAPPSSLPPAMKRLAQENIHAFLEPVLDSAIRCVSDLAAGRADARLDEAFERGSLIEALTVRGELLYVPLHRGRMRLAVRVEALFLADYLYRSEDYRGDLAFCTECGVPLLGAGCREMGLCGEHLRRSGIVPKEGPGLAPARPVAADHSIEVDLSELG